MSNILNIEIKARTNQITKIRAILKENNADCKGVDNQVDTYFQVPRGRLKLREGSIENALIYYERENEEGPKTSNIILEKVGSGSSIKAILTKIHQTLAIVEKNREIYFIGNVKFHIDNVKELGEFVEIEAIDDKGNIPKEKLESQCKHYMDLFGIKREHLVKESYSDLLLKGNN